MNKPCLHFVGFKDDRLWNAVKVFGHPDFYHLTWDKRAKQEAVEGDTIVFADIDETHDPSNYPSWDDSQWEVICGLRAKGMKP